jgi:isopenicillin N synthase-like dioxygenase
MPAGQRFEDFQGLNRPSPDILRLLKYHANSNTDVIPQTPHTDLGSLTFVFSTTPGLQVLPPGVVQKPGAYSESDWLYVEPKPGHAIVNIGDCITMMTNGLLKSALHRVGPVTGCAMPERYSMAYLMRPEDQTLLRPLDSPLIPHSVPTGETAVTSGAWISKKFKALRGTKDAGNFDQILTGGRGILV